MAKHPFMKHFFVTLFIFFSSLVFSQTAQWGHAAQGNGNSWDEATSVAHDANDDVFVTGYFASDSITFGNITLYSNGGADAYVVKYDPFLQPIWAFAIGGPGDEYGMGVACDSNSNVFIVGNYSSGSLTLGSTVLTNRDSGTPDMYIARLDYFGNVIWARGEGCSNWDNVSGVDVSPAIQELYVSGAFYIDTLFIENDTLLNQGNYDMVLMKFDFNGNYQWSRSAGGNFNDLANAVAYDLDGYVITTGGFASDSMPFPTGTLINPVSGLPETWVVKYDAQGNCMWARRAGAGDNDHAVACDVDANGKVYLGGHFHSGSMTFANDTLVNQGQGDVYLLVYDEFGNELWAKAAGGPEQDFGYGLYVDNHGKIYYSGMYTSLNITFGPYTLNNPNINENMFLLMYDSNGNELDTLSGGGLGMDYITSITANEWGTIYAVGAFGTPTMAMGSTTLIDTDPSGNTTDMFIATTGIPLSYSDSNIPLEVSVAPNPSTGLFTFTSDLNTTVSILVYNSLGEEIIAQPETEAKNFSIDLSQYPTGIYFVNIMEGSELTVFKLVKE